MFNELFPKQPAHEAKNIRILEMQAQLRIAVNLLTVLISKDNGEPNTLARAELLRIIDLYAERKVNIPEKDVKGKNAGPLSAAVEALQAAG